MAATPGRFEVEDGEIIDTKARQIISLDQLAKLATPEEQDSIRQQIQDSGWAGADQTESSDSPALARGTVSRPSVTNTPSQQDALPSRPSLQQFMEVAKQDNPDVPDKDLRRYWAQNYSDIDPKTLPSLETFLAAAKEDNPGVPDQALKAYWNENYGDFGAAEKDTHLGIGGTIWEGAKSAGRSLKATGQALIGDESGVVDTANAQQSAPRDIALQNLLTDIQKRKDSLGKDPSWLATIGEMGKAALSNPKGAGLLLAEQLPNSAVALGSGLAGAAAGSALGPIGTIAGGIAGLFAANTALETGGKAIEAGADQSFTPDDRSRVLKEGLTKGAVITGVDVASLGLTNFITGTTARAVERATVKTLTDAGVDVTDRAAVMAATKNPDIFSAVQSAQQRAQVASNALGQRLARGSGAVGAEAVGEGAGEYLGEYAATGEADKMEAVIEAFAGLGQSAGEIAATHGLNRKREASALLQGPAPTAIESIPNQIGVGNPTVSIEQAIVNAQDILSAPVSSTRPQEDALSSRLAQLSASTAAQREADSLESERQLQSGERLPSAQEAAMQADGIPRTGQDIPLLEGQQSSPSTLPIADPSRLWMDEAVVPGIEPGQAFTPRASSEPDAKARLQAERERLLSMRKMPSAPSDMAQPVMSETPSQSDMPIQSAADLAYPSSERGRMPTQEELALRDRGPEKRAAQQVPLIEGGEGDATSTIIPGATFSPRQEPVLTPKERLAAEREKLVRMKATRPAPMPSEPTVPPSSTTSDAPLRSAVDRAYPSVSELHDLARDKGFDVESPVFKTLTKMSTGKTHLDELSPSARDRFAETLKKLTPRETPTIVESPTKKALAPVQPGSPSSDAVTAPRSALPPEQNAEMLLRAEKANADLESSSEMQDTSLIDFLKSKGGLQDQGGELSTMEVDAQRKAFSKKLIQEKGLTLDQAAELAHEAGYIQDRDIALLLDGIDKEVRGKGQHANWYRELTTGPKPMTREAIDSAVAKIIEDHGVDTGAAVERVKAALLNDGEFDGTQWGEDAASIARGDWPAWIPKPDALPQQGATPQQEPVSASPSRKGTTTTPPQSEAATVPAEEPFSLTQQTARADKPKPKATQLSIDVPPPTVGERPIIGREVTPEEAPLFSESAKQPDAQQLDIAQDPEPVAPKVAPEVAPSPTEILASALRTAADQIEGKKAEAKIEDVGEKIGGARKDIAEKTGAKAKVQTPKDETPGWRKRFTIQQVVGSRNPSEVGKWAIHDSKKTDFAGRPRQVGNHLFDSKEEAEAAIPMYAVAMKHRVRWERDGQYAIYRNISDRKVIKVVDQTFPTEDDAKRYMIQHAEEIIELRTNFGEEILPRPDTVTRAGPDYRNGRNVTADDFRQSFDFRAVEFGNWNNQVERQEVMNHAYDGLMDLADTLNIPPKAIGLNGDLALAFGARGQGLSSAVAHYERTYGVINLTKMSGAGHLAHEWMHAADHYFGRQDTKASSEKVANERGDLVFDTNGISDYASHGFRAAGSKVREEVRQAYTNLMKSMFKKGEQFVEDATKAQKFVGEARQEVANKLKQIRDDLGRKHDWMKRNGNPATADQLAEFDTIAQRILDGELFEDKWISAPASKTKRMVMSGRWSNDAVEKMSAIYKAVRNRSGFDSQNQSGAMDKLRSSMKFYSARIKMLADAQQGTEKTKMVPTSYAMEAKAMDQGRAENYWMTEHEMLARAFAAYVEDTLKASGRNSDFITYQTFGAVPTAWGWKKPYPEGQERKDINKSFKDFFSILKTKETEKGTALYEDAGGYLTPSQALLDNSDGYALRENEDPAVNRELAQAALGDLDRAGQVLPGADRTLAGTRPSDTGRTVALSIAPDLIHQGVVDLRGYTVTSSEDLAKLAQVYRDPRFETFRFFYLKGNTIVGHEGATSRMPGFVKVIDTSKQHPVDFMMGIQRRMEELGADGYYLLHNHPSGRSQPSREDYKLTGKIVEAVPGFLAHVVIDSNEYTAIEYNDFDELEGTRHELNLGPDKLLSPSIPHPLLASSISDSGQLAKLGKQMQSPEGFATIVYTNSKNDVRAIQEVAVEFLADYERSKLYLADRATEFGARMVFSYVKTDFNQRALKLMESTKRLIADGVLTDHVSEAANGGGSYVSQADAGVSARHGMVMGREYKDIESNSVAQAVYHGTPHIWEPEPGFPHGRPRLDKMGSGEGAQSYGWGWYSAGNRGTAEYYRKQLSEQRWVTKSGAPITGKDAYYDYSALQLAGNKPDDISSADFLRERAAALRKHGQFAAKTYGGDAASLYERGAQNLERMADEGVTMTGQGSLYELDIPDEVIPTLVDWDKPISDQSSKVRERLRMASIPSPTETEVEAAKKKYLDAYAAFNGMQKGDQGYQKAYGDVDWNYRKWIELRDHVDMSGREMYQALTRKQGSDEAASRHLAKFGIPGLMYLDAGSRSEGEGHHNYVIWHQPTLDKVALLKRNEEKLDAIRDQESAIVAEEAPSYATASRNQGLTYDNLNSPNFPGLPAAQQQAALDYHLPAMSKMDNVIRSIQDKNIDLVRLVDSIKQAGAPIPDELNPVLREELYMGRVTSSTQGFLNEELRPLVDAMRLNKVTLAQLDQYLHARHAKEANAHLKEINPDREDNDALSGMTDEEAEKILAAADKSKMERLAAKVDAILGRTRQMLVEYGLESQSTVDGWAQDYQFYVPLHREGYEDGTPGTGQGRSVRGSHSKSRTGSTLSVTNIMANIAMDRERAIVRGEKMRPVIALAGLLQQYPNKDIATLAKPSSITYTNPETGLQETAAGDIGEYRVPRIKGINKKTGMVEWRPDPLYKGRDNVINFRINGADHAIIFNEENDRAVEMAKSLKDLDVGRLNGVLAAIAPATRYLSSISTQYNPVFGVVNFVRDIQFAMLSLSSTPLADKRAEVFKGTFRALRGIYADARAERKGERVNSEMSKLWERFQKVGGPTGYREMFRGSNDRAKAIEHMLDQDWWQKTLGGKILTANGHLSGMQSLILNKAAKPLFEWLSDYNQTMENAVRLATFKAGLDSGMTDEQAASTAKNLTVNFNKKGAVTTQVGAMYAFFNASVQGTARIADTLFEKGRFGYLSATGKKIVAGGIALGSLQALGLMLAGFGEDEPPEFVRARSLILPMPGTDKGYLAIPMPLGFNILPNFGRLVTESLIHGKPMDRAYTFMANLVDTFSPVGGAGSVSQFLAPSVADPLVALSENKDWAGRKISKEDFNAMKPTPGHTRAKDSSTPWARGLSEMINYATGGTNYVPGKFSPTPDAIDYLIGSLTGGVGRELAHTAQSVTGLTTGEDVPLHKVPLVGRFVGDAAGPSAVRNDFYENLSDVHQAYEEVHGRLLHREDATDFLADHPEARLEKMATHLQREISQMTKRKREMVAKGESRERVRLLEMQISSRMQRFNDRVRELQDTR